MNSLLAIVGFLLTSSFILTLHLKAYYSTKIYSLRKNTKYEGLFIELHKFDQIKNYAFVFIPFIIKTEPEDDEQILRNIKRYNISNTSQIIIYLTILFFFVVLAIFFPDPEIQ